MKTKMFKKMTAMILAVMMVVSVMPMMASAATPNGDYYETLTFIRFDEMTKVTDTVDTKLFVKDGADYKVQMNGWPGKLDWRNQAEKPEDFDKFLQAQGFNVNAASEWPMGDVTKGLTFCRNFTDTNGDSIPDKEGEPNSDIEISNLYDTSKNERGDRIKITSWVYPSRPVYNASTGRTDIPQADMTEDMKCSVRMWLWAPSVKNASGGWDDVYSSNAPQNWGPYADECWETPVPFNEWSEISFEYNIASGTGDEAYHSKDNTNVASIRMDNHGAMPYYYPRHMLIGGYKVEKFIKAGGTYGIEEGTVKGSVALGIDETVTAGTHKVIVAAYNNQNMFIGCDIKDYTKGSSFDFEIENAADADSVKAFLWDISKFEPKITPLTLSLAY